MKKLLVVLCLALMLTFSATAHSGGTDGQGGHHSGSGYHYHHGYSAHDHYDMDNDGDLDCPYDFKNNEHSQAQQQTAKNDTADDGSSVSTSYNIISGPTLWDSVKGLLLILVCVFLLPVPFYVLYFLAIGISKIFMKVRNWWRDE